jgi:hypothetical protein
MKSTKKYPHLKHFPVQYAEMKKNAEIANKQYGKFLQHSTCQTCNVFNASFFSTPIEQRHIHCSTCQHNRPLIQSAQLIIKLKTEIKAFEDLVYAKAIYETLSKDQPGVFDKRLNKILAWKDLIGNDYSEVLKQRKQRYLIELFEEEFDLFQFKD